MTLDEIKIDERSYDLDNACPVTLTHPIHDGHFTFTSEDVVWAVELDDGWHLFLDEESPINGVYQSGDFTLGHEEVE